MGYRKIGVTVVRGNDAALIRKELGEHVVLFAVHTSGVTEEDARVAELLRSVSTPVFVVANKVDDASHEALMWEFLSLGLGNPLPVTALHGLGTGDLLEALVEVLPEPDEEPTDEIVTGPDPSGQRVFAVALVGRPNVGKSTLFNRLIGEDRSVVHDMPGTTRDAIDTIIETDHGPIRFVDTAGMRRKARIEEGTEYYSFVRALKAVDSSDVALLVIDATEGVTHQDQRLAERIDAAGCPIVVIMNKWELLDTDASPYLFLSGCAENQVRFYDRLDAIVLLSAPTDLLLNRLATRTNNDYGKRPEEVADVLGYVETVEPRLRRGAHLEIDTSASLGSVVERLLGFVGAPRYVRVDAAAPAGSVP